MMSTMVPMPMYMAGLLVGVREPFPRRRPAKRRATGERGRLRQIDQADRVPRCTSPRSARIVGGSAGGGAVGMGSGRPGSGVGGAGSGVGVPGCGTLIGGTSSAWLDVRGMALTSVVVGAAFPHRRR